MSKKTIKQLENENQKYEIAIYGLYEQFHKINSSIYMITQYIENTPNDLNKLMISRSLDLLWDNLIDIESNIQDYTGLTD
jgi:hypothetical protein